MSLVMVFLLFLSFPVSLHAEENAEPMSRREGFLLIWHAIKRPAKEVREEPFTDVSEGSEGFLEITYAKARGILNDTELFVPEQPLTLHDALLWMYRTHNIAPLDEMQSEDLPALILAYPVTHPNSDLSILINRDALAEYMRKLDTLLVSEFHQVSFYGDGDGFHGAGTAFGETFDQHAITAAHRTLPHNTLVKVTNAENGKSVVVRINDRGPYIHGRDMDLSTAAFRAISPDSRGVIYATFERLGDVSLVSACNTNIGRYQQRITRDVRFRRGIPHEFAVGQELILSANKPFVVQRVRYPDGLEKRLQNWILPEKLNETFTFTPSVPGRYAFLVGTVEGRRRWMHMNVMVCPA